MNNKDVALVLDCGATNIRVVAIDSSGQILSGKSFSNETSKDPHFKGGRIWDIEIMWNKLCKSARHVISEININRIAGVTVTTFGVDGTFVDSSGNLKYPVISWQCQRTQPILKYLDNYIEMDELYEISGVYPYAFNTIYKLMWFKKNYPEIISESYRFIFISSILIFRLTGVLKNDITMAGTSMMLDISNRVFSEKIHEKLDINSDIWGEIGEPGELAGLVHEKAFKATGIPSGTPVFFAGHDTQYAIFGSGAKLNQPVLSSGTWEILMVRTKDFSSTKNELSGRLTTELDAIPGRYNIGQTWLGSGILEWVTHNFYPELEGEIRYETIISEAEQIEPGASGIKVNPDFYNHNEGLHGGSIHGLTIESNRSQIYRAFLESLAYRLREGIESLQTAGNFKANQIICVGGGSKNRLWNQLRADVCQVPIQLIDQKETTVLGASMFVFSGCGLFCSPEAAREQINYKYKVIYPSEKADILDKLYIDYKRLRMLC